MLVLEIALGIILAAVLIAMTPVVVGCTLATFAHVIVALTKPRRGILTPVPVATLRSRGQTPRQRQIASL